MRRSGLPAAKSYAQQAALKLAVFAAALAIYAILSSNRIHTWKDDYTLWKDSSAKSPHSARAHGNLALAAYGEGLFDEALAEAQKSVNLYYYYAGSHYAVGLVFYEKGFYEKSIAALKWALLLEEKYINNPAYEAEIRNSLGLAYEAMGYLDLADMEFEKTDRLRKEAR